MGPPQASDYTRAVWIDFLIAAGVAELAPCGFASRVTTSLLNRIDCNRGRGTWQSSGSNQRQFGLLALTRAACPAGSMHDQIVK